MLSIRTWIQTVILTTLWPMLAHAHGTDFQEIDKFLASGGGDDDFGEHSAISGDWSWVGAPNDSGFTGAAYAFRFDGTTWVEAQRLTDPNGESGDGFGYRVAVDGEFALSSSPGDDDNTGAVHAYRVDGGVWLAEQTIVPDDAIPFDLFGIQLCMQEGVALITAREDSDGGKGAVYVYRHDGTSWVLEQKLVAFDGEDEDSFGTGLALEGDRAFVGASNDEGGSVYVYRHDGGEWTFEQKLRPDPMRINAHFGECVAVDGNVLVVGAPVENFRGVAYVFGYDGVEWVQEQRVVANEGQPNGFFGNVIAIDDDCMLIRQTVEVNGRGAVLVFRYEGTQWSETQKILPSDSMAQDLFGISIALDGDLALVGAQGRNSEPGSVYMFFGADCMSGSESPEGVELDVLFVDGSMGGPDRTVEASETDFVTVSVLKPLFGGNGRFVLHGSLGTPTVRSDVVLPFDIGSSCFSFFTKGVGEPVIVANNLGKRSLVGESVYFGIPIADPDPATTHLAFPNFPAGTVLTFQAIIQDPASSSSKGVRVTNAVILEVGI